MNSLTDVEQCAGIGTIGRPHIAQVLLLKKYVSSIKDAFEQFLGSHGKAYVQRAVPEAREIIGWIIDAGGVPVLAHPYWEGLNKEESIAACQTLADQGLQGLEVFYGTFSARHISFNLGLARQFDLLMTGGSDKSPSGVLRPVAVSSSLRRSAWVHARSAPIRPHVCRRACTLGSGRR